MSNKSLITAWEIVVVAILVMTLAGFVSATELIHDTQTEFASGALYQTVLGGTEITPEIRLDSYTAFSWYFEDDDIGTWTYVKNGSCVAEENPSGQIHLLAVYTGGAENYALASRGDASIPNEFIAEFRVMFDQLEESGVVDPYAVQPFGACQRFDMVNSFAGLRVDVYADRFVSFTMNGTADYPTNNYFDITTNAGQWYTIRFEVDFTDPAGAVQVYRDDTWIGELTSSTDNSATQLVRVLAYARPAATATVETHFDYVKLGTETTELYSTGTYTSDILDLGTVSSLGLLSWTEEAASPYPWAAWEKYAGNPITSGLIENILHDIDDPLQQPIQYDGKYWVCYATGGSPGYIRLAYSTDPDLLVWTDYEANPVLSPTGGESYVFSPHIFKDGSTYYLVYDVSVGGTQRNAYATASAPTGPYTKGQTILDVGAPGEWDDLRVTEPYIFKEGGTYFMYYMGDSGCSGCAEQIGLATTTAALFPLGPEPGGLWTKHGLVLPHDPDPSGWDRGLTADPSIIKVGDTYYMRYTGSYANEHWQLGCAWADDPYGPWTRPDGPEITLGSPGAWDDDRLVRGAIHYHNGSYISPYTGCCGYQGGMATASLISSENLITFETRTSPDGSAWEAWQSAANGGSIQSTPNTYFQYRSTFSASAGLSPTLTSVTIAYTEVPAVPELINPPNLSSTADVTPTLEWSATAGVGGTYTLQYATDAGFTTGLVTVTGIGETTYTVAVALVEDTYYWHVQAWNSGGDSSGYQTTPFSFTVAGGPPVVTLNAPADAFATTDTSVVLSATVTDPDSDSSYVTFYCDDVDASSPVYVQDNVASGTTLNYTFTRSVLQPDVSTIGLWHFDEGSGGVLHDVSGNGQDGYWHCDSTLDEMWDTDGPFGHALHFSGFRAPTLANPCAADYVEVPDNAGLDVAPGEALSIEFWVNPDVLPASRYWGIVGKRIPCLDPDTLQCGTAANYEVFFNYPTQTLGFYGNSTLYVSTCSLTVSAWQYIAVTVDGPSGRLRFYKNGARVQQRTGAIGALVDGPVRIGSSAYRMKGVDGVIDEVRISRRELDSAEIAQNFRRAAGTYYWRVTADDGINPVTESSIRTFAINPVPPPDVPTLLNPLDAATISDNTPTLLWSATAGVGGTYTLEYATNAGFTVGLVTMPGIVGESYTVPGALANGTYYWHVKAIDAALTESGYQSTPFSFTITIPGETDPPLVTLLTPGDGSTVFADHAGLSASVSDASPPMTVWIYGDQTPSPTSLLYVEEGVADLATVNYDWSASVLQPEAPYTMGLWHFDEASGTTLTDASGNANGGIFVNAPAWTTAGRFGHALDFDGTNDFVAIPDDPSLDVDSATGAVTMEVWVYPRSSGGGVYRSILAKRGFGSGAGPTNYQMSLNNTDGNLLFFNGDVPAGILVSSVGVPLNEWSYLAITLDAIEGRLRFYRNGTLLDSIDGATFGGAHDSGLYIGTANQVAECFDGLIDEVRVTSRVLTPAEIGANYHLSTGTYYWKVTAEDNQSNPGSSGIWSFDLAPPVSDTDPPLITLDFPFDGEVTPDPFMLLGTTVSDVSPPMTVWIYGDQSTDPTNLLHVQEGVADLSQVTFDWSASVLQPESPYTMGLWHFEEASGAVTADAGANGNVGTLVGPPSWTSGGRFGYALDFNGTTDYVTVPHSASLDVDSATGALTMEAWVYPRAAGGDNVWRTIASKSEMGNSSQVNYRMSLDRTTGNLLFYSGRFPEIWISSVNVPVDEWSYVALSLDAVEGKLRFYRNGEQLDSTSAGSAWFGPAYTSTLNIGVSFSLVEAFDGLIDEVRLSNRVLSAAEIAANYQLSDGVYYWKVAATDSFDNLATAGPRSFRIGPGAPVAPALISPPDLTLTTDGTPMFVWSSTAGPGGSYTLQYALDAGFATGLVTVPAIGDSTYTVGGALADNTYYWRVQAKNSVGDSSGYQTPFSFTVDTEAPAPPTLINPSNLAVIGDNTPTFDWSATAGAGGTYTLQYSTDAAFVFAITVPALGAPTYTVPVALPDDVYYWRVKGKDAVGNEGAYQAVPWQFTIMSGPVAVPILVVPLDLSFTCDTTPTFIWTNPPPVVTVEPAAEGESAMLLARQTIVSYSLQYSTDPTFATMTTVGVVAETTYTVPDTAALDDTTYYWRVEAIDMTGIHSGYQPDAFEFGIFVAADVNADAIVTSADIIYLVNFIFKGGPAPEPCPAVGDMNCDQLVTAADIIYLVNYVFKGGPPPCNVGDLISDHRWLCP